MGKSICSFAGGRLTFLKLGLASVGIGGCVLNFVLKATGSQILAFQCDRELIFACSLEFNACHDKSIRSFLTCSVCLLMMRSECVWAVQIFS